MRAFADRPLTNKLMIIILSTSATALILTMVINVVREGLVYREAYTDQLSTLTEVVGTNSVAALTFDDENLASQVLDSLTAEPGVIAAHLLDRQGEYLAYYRNDEVTETPAGSLPVDQALIDRVIADRTAMHEFEGLEYIDMVRPVEFDGDIIGYVQVRANLERLESRLKNVTGTAIIAILIAVLIAYLVSVKLQAVISTPILALVDVMKGVTADKNYELRAVKRSNDEIGTLIDGFNEMLKDIEERDLQLATKNEALRLAAKTSMQAKEAAEAASVAKSEFLARMSHEIRTPMNGVLGMTQLLSRTSLDDDQTRLVQTVEQSAESLLEIIDDILDFSKIEANKLVLEAAELDVRNIIEDCAELLSPRAMSKGVDIVVSIDPAADVTMLGDATRIRQILLNLIGNAIKFTKEGEILIRLDAVDSTRTDPTPPIRDSRHRNRYQQGQSTTYLRFVFAGRRHDDTAIRWHRSRVGHL